jgi:hypothetical protein
MTEHLPECWATLESDPPAWCICDELRACEARIRDEDARIVKAALLDPWPWRALDSTNAGTVKADVISAVAAIKGES